MNATLPYDYAQPRIVNGRVRTCRLLTIGIAHQQRTDYSLSTDEALIQAALLAPPRRDGHRWIIPASLAALACLAAFMCAGWV